jgi:hypothetical protein
MSKEFRIGTPSLFKCIGQNGKTIKRALIVDRLGDFHNDATVPRQDSRRQGLSRAVRISEDVSQ